MEIKSDAFQANQTIPSQYTCDGDDLSPPLAWTGAPNETKSFALIADDPDAPMGTWVHWVLYDLPAAANRLDEDISKAEILPDGVKQGLTDFGTTGYGGPCPPPGKPHRYFFKLYALDELLNLPPRLTKNQLLKSIKEHILSEAELIGVYSRLRR